MTDKYEQYKNLDKYLKELHKNHEDLNRKIQNEIYGYDKSDWDIYFFIVVIVSCIAIPIISFFL